MTLKILKSRYAFLWPLIFLLIFNLSLRYTEFLLGNQNAFLERRISTVALYINFCLGLAFTFTCFYKSKRIKHFDVSPLSVKLLLGLAFLLRTYMVYLGYNYDLESYDIVSKLVLEGKNFYAFTERYNYGPVWAYLIALLRLFSGTGPYQLHIFHLLIVILLFAFELFFYKMIFKIYKDQFLIFLLIFNPISIVIIGHHSQFDLLAIALAFYSYLQLKNNKILKAVLILGLSLCVKHNMVFFPLILLFDSSLKLKDKVLYATIPAIIFMLSFLPFIGAFDSIFTNVLSYQHNSNQSLFRNTIDLILPYFVTQTEIFKILGPEKVLKLIWVCFFIILGFYANKYQIKEKFFLYLLALVASSPAISEQYLLIPLAAVFYYRTSIFSWLYLSASSYFICFVSVNNLSKYFGLEALGIHLSFDEYAIGYALIQCLLFGVIISAFINRNNIKA